MGTSAGTLVSWPGVGGVFCEHSSVNVFAAASYAVRTVSLGVPACGENRQSE